MGKFWIAPCWPGKRLTESERIRKHARSLHISFSTDGHAHIYLYGCWPGDSWCGPDPWNKVYKTDSVAGTSSFLSEIFSAGNCQCPTCSGGVVLRGDAIDAAIRSAEKSGRVNLKRNPSMGDNWPWCLICDPWEGSLDETLDDKTQQALLACIAPDEIPATVCAIIDAAREKSPNKRPV